MKSFALCVVTMSVACVWLGGCTSQANPPEKKYKVEPISVVWERPPAHQPGDVSGTFKLVESADGYPPSSIENGVPVVTGGACLVYQDKRSVKSCQSDADCSPPVAGGHGYCHPTEKQCWFKDAPGSFPDNADGYKVDAYCLKSGPVKSLHVDQVNKLQVVNGHPAQYRWRITTCQGLVAGGCGSGDPDKLRPQWGDVLEH